MLVFQHVAGWGDPCRKLPPRRRLKKTGQRGGIRNLQMRKTPGCAGYSRAKASTGSSFDADLAGRKPKLMPITVDDTTAATIDVVE